MDSEPSDLDIYPEFARRLIPNCNSSITGAPEAEDGVDNDSILSLCNEWMYKCGIWEL